MSILLFVLLAFRQGEQLIGIISPIGKELVRRQTFKQITSRYNVVYVTRGELKAQRIADCINDSMDFGD